MCGVCSEVVCVQASTECNLRQGCHNAGGDAYFCGPYTISWGYWAEAGKPGQDPSNVHECVCVSDFEICLKDKQCAENTVRGYMARYGQDCDGDHEITCADYARMHKAGRYSCNGTWVDDTIYWQRIEECFESG
ncbi:hypothetical protein LAZ67_20000486, partial [Cordylochernes scorpioides]